MIIVADANIPALAETFGRHGEVRVREGRTLRRSQLRDAHALIVRSVTRVDASLLEGTPVTFVGTATIGTDHLDTDWLEERGIAWASAPGCNADAAAQYALAMMLLAWKRLGRDPARETVGIIGRGNVGGRLQSLLGALAIPTAACDPPLAERGEVDLVSQSEALAQSTVSLHVPLTRAGPHATLGLIGAAELRALPRGSLLVNAARGAVLQAAPLAAWLAARRGHAALDTWPGEPAIDQFLLNSATVATPHVAGYSEDGKRRGTIMIHRAFCEHFRLPHEPIAPLPPARLDLAQGEDRPEDPLIRAVLAATGVERDDRALRDLAPLAPEARGEGFDALRRDYPPRREFQYLRPTGLGQGARDRLEKLGFDLGDPCEGPS
jgi:erythronate-4-phosphate dehydrogenase